MAGETDEPQDGEALLLTDEEYEATFGTDGEPPPEADPGSGDGKAAPDEGSQAGEGEGAAEPGEGSEAGQEGAGEGTEAGQEGGEETQPANQGEQAGAESGEGTSEAGTEEAGSEAGSEGEGEGEAMPEWARQPFAPQYQPNARDIQTIDGDIQQLDKQFEEGELDLGDYQSRVRELERERTKAEVAQEFSQQSVEQAWGQVQEAFFGANPQYAQDPALYGALDATLRELYADENYANYSMAQYLVEAKRRVDARFGQAQDDTAQASGDQGDQSAQPDGQGQAQDQGQGQGQGQGQPSSAEVAQQRGGRPEAPASLAGVPEAEGEGTDPWAHLNQLMGQGLDYEEALAKLTPEQAERYLAEG